MRTVCVFNRNRESFVGLRVVPADTWRMRLKGLLGNGGMRREDGIWLMPSRAIHTFGMRYAVDLIYLNAANRVIDLVERLRPFRISPIRIQCASILEMRSRAIAWSNTRVGDDLIICVPDQMRECIERNRPQRVGADGRE